jgi:hypothetical protein
MQLKKNILMVAKPLAVFDAAGRCSIMEIGKGIPLNSLKRGRRVVEYFEAG